MGFGYILIGLLFFANPNINIIDFIPDVIGCIFIVMGLRKLSDIDGRFYNARTSIYYLMAVSVFKLALSLYIPLYRQSVTMPFTFIFSVVEAILLFAFFANFYKAVEYTTERHGGKNTLQYSSTAALTSFLFSISRSILSFLPEATELILNEDDLSLGYSVAMRKGLSIKPYVFALCFILGIAIGIMFLFVTIKQLRLLMKDEEYNKKLCDKYREEILDNKPVLTRRYLKFIFVLILLGIFFMFDFVIDGINILPDFIGYFILLLALYQLQKHFIKGKRIVLLMISLLFVSIFSYIYKMIMNFGVSYIIKNETFISYNIPSIANGKTILPSILIMILQQSLFLFLIFRIFKALGIIFNEKSNESIDRSVNVIKVSSILFALFSSVSYVLPQISAYFYGQKNYYLYEKVESLYVTISFLMVVSVIFITTIILRIKRRIELYF